MKRAMWVCLGLVALIVCSGCCGTYLRNRGRDAADIMDVGITVSKRPYLGVYPGDYFNLTPMGYVHMKGTLHGLWCGRWTSVPIEDRAWGVVAWGRQRLVIGEFNPEDPRQFWPEEIAALKAANKPLPTKPKAYNVGFLRIACHGNRPPYPNCWSCRRGLHLGWVGFWASLHADQIVDFFAGWLGCDPQKDDLPAAAAPTPEPAAPAKK